MALATAYPLINETTTESLTNLLQYVNGVVQPYGTFGAGLLVLVFGVSMLSLTSLKPAKRLLASLYLSSFVSVMLTALSLIPYTLTIGLFIFTFLVALYSGRELMP